METILHQTFNDNRGSYTPVPLNILDMNWTQCSISVNDKAFTFRGLHYQTTPPQTKYVKVVKGLIVDIIVDLETKEVEYSLVSENEGVFIPNTKAHGFLTLEDNTEVLYQMSDFYYPELAKGIRWDDPLFAIKWPKISQLIISEKDSSYSFY